jgi:hypothetical protein
MRPKTFAQGQKIPVTKLGPGEQFIAVRQAAAANLQTSKATGRGIHSKGGKHPDISPLSHRIGYAAAFVNGKLITAFHGKECRLQPYGT